MVVDLSGQGGFNVIPDDALPKKDADAEVVDAVFSFVLIWLNLGVAKLKLTGITLRLRRVRSPSI